MTKKGLGKLFTVEEAFEIGEATLHGDFMRDVSFVSCESCEDTSIMLSLLMLWLSITMAVPSELRVDMADECNIEVFSIATFYGVILFFCVFYGNCC
jgi:hypothetical protein